MSFLKENLHGSLANAFIFLAGFKESATFVRLSRSEKQEMG